MTAAQGAITTLQGQTNANAAAAAANGAAIGVLQGQTTANSAAIAAVDGRVTTLNSQVTAGTIGLVQQASAGAPITVGADRSGDRIVISGSSGTRQLTGLSAGAVTAGSTDAVTGAQLLQTNQAVVAVASLLIGQSLGGFGSDNSAGLGAPAPTGANSSAGGAGAVASGTSSMAVGNASTASAAGSTALGHGASATGTNSVALGAGSSDGGEANVVSVGTPQDARRITNVSAGVSARDAVNLQQLQAALNQSMAGNNAYVDQQVAGLRADMSRLRRDVEGGTAAAMAVAAIPQSMDAGRGMMGGGVGLWQGQSAFALGASKSTDDGRFAFKAGATVSARGQAGGSAGFGISF